MKWGQVYRSGELPKLTDADVAVLEGLELQAVANFLLPEEIEKHGRDRLPQGVREIPMPITSEGTAQLSLAAHRAMETGDFSLLPPEVSLEVHRLFARRLHLDQRLSAVPSCSHRRNLAPEQAVL